MERSIDDMEGQSLEGKKRFVLRHAIEVILPDFAEVSPATAAWFARETLSDILNSNNPDLAPSLRAKVLELGIDMDLDQAV